MVLCMCCAGLMVRERNWLDVYPYTNWGGRDALPVFQEGQSFMPHELLLQDVRSTSFCGPATLLFQRMPFVFYVCRFKTCSCCIHVVGVSGHDAAASAAF